MLVEDGTPGAIIRNADCVPAGSLSSPREECHNEPEALDCHCLVPGYCSPNMAAQVTVINPVPDSTYSLLVRMRDEDNYIEARLVWDASENVYLQVWQRVEGVETMLVECGPTHVVFNNQSATITICVTDEKIYASTTGIATFGNIPDTTPPDIPLAYHGGLKHTSTTQTAFSSYSITQLNIDEPTCPACGPCLCQTEPEIRWPRKLLLTFIDLNGNWPGLDGLTMELKTNECLGPSVVYGGSYLDLGTCLSPRTCYASDKVFEAYLVCASFGDTPDAMPDLTLDAGGHPIADARCIGIHWILGGAVPDKAPDESSCSPFMLTYYYENSSPGPDCGAYPTDPACCDEAGGGPPKCCECADWVFPPIPPPTNICPVILKIIITEAP